MRFQLVILLFVFSLVSGSINSAFGQTSDDHIVINEIDINPPGDDSASINEWVELYNPTNSDVDIGGWEIASTTILKKTLTIPDGTIIESGSFLIFSYSKVWFTDVSEVVQLRDNNENIIDETREMTDVDDDFKSWQRIYDGHDTNFESDWYFFTSTTGSTNGQNIITQESTPLTVSVSVDKPEFVFNEIATISGSISEQMFIIKPTFMPEKIELTITGPNFYSELAFYPDSFLNFETSLNLQKVLGVTGGIYNVSVTYADATANTQFFVGEENILIQEKEESIFTLSFDKESYIPGESVKIIATTNEIIPLEGLKFQTFDPDGIQIYGGTLYPDTSGEFSTTMFMTTVLPVFQQYLV